MAGRVLRFPQRSASSEESRTAAERILRTPFLERLSKIAELRLDHPETLLSITDLLRDRRDTSPPQVCSEAEFFYRFLEKPGRKVGLFDEHQYFLGEFALIAGTACRQ